MILEEDIKEQSEQNELWLRHRMFGDMTDEEIEQETGMDWDGWYIVYATDEYWRD